MSSGKRLTDTEALEALRSVIAVLPSTRHSVAIVEEALKERGAGIGYRRIKALVQQHRLFEMVPVRASAQLVLLSDHRKSDSVVREVQVADTLGKLEALANALLDRLNGAVSGLVIDNANQFATVTGAAANLVRVISTARGTLAGLGEARTPDGSVAGAGGYLKEADVLARYGPKRREVLEREKEKVEYADE